MYGEFTLKYEKDFEVAPIPFRHTALSIQKDKTFSPSIFQSSSLSVQGPLTSASIILSRYNTNFVESKNVDDISCWKCFAEMKKILTLSG